VDAQNARIWTASVVIGIEPKSAQAGQRAVIKEPFAISAAPSGPGQLNLRTSGMLFQELAGHDHALDLAGAFVDLGGRRAVSSFRR
jgi:hypothetical protein